MNESKKHAKWLPKQGKPEATFERISQAIIKSAAFLPVYISFITTLTLLFVIFGVPFVGGR